MAGWTNLNSANFQGPISSVQFKKVGSQITGSEDMTFVGDDVPGVQYSTLTLNGSVVGGFVGSTIDGNKPVIDTPTYVLEDYRAVLYGPITIANGTTVTIGNGAHVKVRDWSSI